MSNICFYIKELVAYAADKALICEADRTWATNARRAATDTLHHQASGS